MLNFLKKLLLYLSVFIPLYFLLLIKLFIQIVNKNLSFTVLNHILLIGLSVLTLLGVIGLCIAFSQKHNADIVVVDANNITEKHFLGYFSLFVLFALSFQIELVAMAIVFAFILIFIGIVYIRNNLFYINPMLNIIGFSFYQVKYHQKGSDEIKETTMLFYGKLTPNKMYHATLTPYNFNFIEKH